ncbi:transposase [Thermoactinospora rubra]|uniref:transposase n=1 Tax=Thermoactinospora rubra TaxID=1088767 RepID=UPI00197E589E|nr:transposase [Thermoactinospora rubra]
MNQDQAAAARAVTVAHAEHAALQQELLARVARCFPRRESRATCGQRPAGLLMELENKNCWTLAEAVGHSTPDRLQHFLARACWDEQQVMAQAARWGSSH